MLDGVGLDVVQDGDNHRRGFLPHYTGPRHVLSGQLHLGDGKIEAKMSVMMKILSFGPLIPQF